MRNRPQGEKRYVDLLKEVVRGSIEAFENQDVQFEDLIDKLEIIRDASHNPLFDINMVVQNFGEKRQTITDSLRVRSSSGKEIEPLYENVTSKFDMTFYVQEHGESISIGIEYYSAIFQEATIARQAMPHSGASLCRITGTRGSNSAIRAFP